MYSQYVPSVDVVIQQGVLSVRVARTLPLEKGDEFLVAKDGVSAEKITSFHGGAFDKSCLCC